jgi:hypothetical protein
MLPTTDFNLMYFMNDELACTRPSKTYGSFLRRLSEQLVYADDVNLLGGSRYTVKKNIEALTDAGKEVGLEVNTEKTK